MSRARTALATATLVALAACAGPPAGSEARRGAPLSSGAEANQAALRASRDAGAVAAGLTLHLSLTLSGRNQAALGALLARGGRVTPAEYAHRFGPDPEAVAAVRRTLGAAGLVATWQPGDPILAVTGAAADAERFFRVSVHERVTQDGRHFHVPVGAVAVPASIAGTVSGVTGFDDTPTRSIAAIRDSNGVSPADMIGFYDARPLRDAHLDGTGVTVVFPEWGVPDPRVYAGFTRKFGLPPMNVEVVHDAAWGTPATPSDGTVYYEVAGEAALDVETVHGIAPGAREVILSLGDPSQLPTVVKEAARRYPGQILSSSISSDWCEQQSAAGAVVDRQLDTVSTAVAAQGFTIFFASFDRGAYACLPNGDSSTLSVNGNTVASGVTSVGGTAVFLASNGQYGSEAAWGEPAETWGGGGGVSTLIPRPAWQHAPGLDEAVTMRAVPDVAANSDGISAWDIWIPDPSNPAGSETPVCGTSAATPFWAGVTALIDQDLAAKHLPAVGFLNPILYALAAHPQGMPAEPFHDITRGNNLHFKAGPGWDFATGLGTPDVAALADDLEWYQGGRQGG